MSRAVVVRSLTAWLAILALPACSAGSMGGASSDAVGPSGTAGNQTALQARQACRNRVNEMTDKQNRGAIYAANSSLNTPFSANFLPSNSSRGLSDQFAYERAVAECESNSPSGPDVNAPAIETPIPPAAKGR